LSKKKELIKNTFGKIPDKKIKASFFINRKSFENYIKKISNGQTPPSWATGCFYNGEIQTLINLNNEQRVKMQSHTLTHEFVHLCFEFYNSLNIPRICWFDESYATFIDGSKDNISLQNLNEIIKKLKTLGNFDMNIISNSNKYITENYNAYDMFLVIGKYIFNKHLEKQLLDLLKSDYKKIKQLGKTILVDAINYLDNLN